MSLHLLLLWSWVAHPFISQNNRRGVCLLRKVCHKKKKKKKKKGRERFLLLLKRAFGSLQTSSRAATQTTFHHVTLVQFQLSPPKKGKSSSGKTHPTRTVFATFFGTQHTGQSCTNM